MEEKKDKEKEAAGIDEESDSGGLEEESPRQSWLKVGAKIFGAIALFYFFICSLDLLGDAFQLLAGKGAGDEHNVVIVCSDEDTANDGGRPDSQETSSAATQVC